MLIQKTLTKEQLEELFEEQRAVFSDTISDGSVYRPRADFYILGKRVATLMYPKFEDNDHMIKCFEQAAWFPKAIRADMSILYMDTSTEVVHKTTGMAMESDVFLCIQTSAPAMDHKSCAYYMNPDVEYPVWNTDYELTDANIFSLRDIIGSLWFAITSVRHTLNIQVLIEYLHANGFQIEFHYPYNAEALMVIENGMFF